MNQQEYTILWSEQEIIHAIFGFSVFVRDMSHDTSRNTRF